MIGKSTFSILRSQFVSYLKKKIGSTCFRTHDNVVAPMERKTCEVKSLAAVDDELYNHLRASEAKKRPSNDYMNKVQNDLTIGMRAILIDWLVEVGEVYNLHAETLYLSVNYIDRYLSVSEIDEEMLQLLGVTCMMIASKYEDTNSPSVEEFCDVTDNTYSPDEILEMERNVLHFLKFELSVPTVRCFLECFVRVSQEVTEAPPMRLECMSYYLAELSLRDYDMLCYAPSVIAASSVFLARYVLLPSTRPWNATLQQCTRYKPLDLLECVKALHTLCCGSPNSSLAGIKIKYSQHTYKFVAEMNCPLSIPEEYFKDI